LLRTAIFKTDVQAETPEFISEGRLHGVLSWKRGSGIGGRCFVQLTQLLLKRTRSICLLANEENEKSSCFCRMCGFKQED